MGLEDFKDVWEVGHDHASEKIILLSSIGKQGQRGYGLEAQRKAITDYLDGGRAGKLDNVAPRAGAGYALVGTSFPSR
jgi:hypothetical protein